MSIQTTTDASPLEIPKPQVADRFLRALGGFKLTLSCFAILGLFAAIGSVLPQGEDTPRIGELYGQQALDLAVKLGVNDVYRSWWFILLLAVMALNLIMVTWVRIPHVWRISRETDAVLLKDPLVPKTAFYRSWETGLDPLRAADIARKTLQLEFPKLAVKEGPNSRLLAGERHFVSLWSAHIVHLGLLCWLAAGAIKVLFGSTHYVIIKEGEQAAVTQDQVRWGFFTEKAQVPGTDWTLPLPYFYDRVEGKAPFELHLDRFEIRHHPGSLAPSLFRSDVRIIKDGKVERVDSIMVNHPMEQDGVMFYQSSWGYEGLYSAHFEVQLPGQKDRLDVRAPYQERIQLLDTGWQLELTDFYPDATMAGPGKLVNQSAELKNPAIRVKFLRGGKELSHTWFVYAAPDIQMAKVPGLKLFGKTVDPVAFTVLQANADAGVWLAFAGACLVLTGVFTAFYMFYRKAWALVEPLPQGGSRVTLAGFVRRNKQGFKRVFDRLSQSLDQGLGGPGGA